MNAGLGGTVEIIGTGTIKQIKVAECHDCFTITEIVNYEDWAPSGRVRATISSSDAPARCR